MVVQGIAASDAEDLRWLRAGWLKTLRKRTSIYSVVTAGLTLVFGIMGLFELFEDDITAFEVGLSIVVFLGGVGVALVVVLGVELHRWLGLAIVIAHALVSVYYLGFSDERQNAIAALQELPIMAMYFSWFYGARIARIGELAILVCVGSAAILGPFSTVYGLLGPANVFTAALFTWLSLEAGLYVRHRILLESHTDELTGALNRRGFLAKADREFQRSVRRGWPISIAVLDLDDFKAVNDDAGHAAGDDVLRVETAQWMSLTRSYDIVGRLGGDEFALLLPETNEKDALTIMRRLRDYAAHPWSWGVVEVHKGESVEAALGRADAAMYDDKRG
ncbi:GGDEF domain-containing protein [Microbacterium sp. NPDC077644]|uniref:GGDEF domain-containing protein n=1 Tax=Microbacterium sp. NPDC077644 TaxID=3155055 RepID=UPI00344EEB6F